MPLFNRLLVPLDGSQLAEAVLPVTAYLAGKFNASVALIHIIEENAPKEIHGERHLTSYEEAHAYLETVAKRAFAPEVPVVYHVHTAESSNVARSIVEHVGEFDSDLIVMCTHGRGGLHSWLFGSIAQQVIGTGPCPVLLIQPADEDTNPAFLCQNILVPLDGHPDHEGGLPIAAELARNCSAAVHLVIVIHRRDTLSGARAAISRLMPGATSALLDLVHENASDYLKRLTTPLQEAGLSVSAHVQRGEPAAVVAQQAEEIGADLIVLGTHGKAGMDAFWEGSMTPKIARRSHLPILLVRVRESEEETQE